MRCRPMMGLAVLVLLLTWSLGSPPAERPGRPGAGRHARGGDRDRIPVISIPPSRPAGPPTPPPSSSTTACSGAMSAATPVPELAESWQVEQGGAVYRFRLRDGVKWHDGTPFTASDVKFTFEEVLLKFHARTRASMGGGPRRHRGSRRPDRGLPIQAAVRPPAVPARRDRGADRRAAHLPGHRSPDERGERQSDRHRALQVRLLSKGTEIRLARNPTYFKPGLPHLDGLVMRIIPDLSVAGAGARERRGRFPVGAAGPACRVASRATRDSGLPGPAYHPGGSNCIMTMSFNLERPILKEPRVRRAVAHAIDRQAFLPRFSSATARWRRRRSRARFRGRTRAASACRRLDRAEAERLLDAVGWRKEGEGARTARGVSGVADGTRLSIDFLHFPDLREVRRAGPSAAGRGRHRRGAAAARAGRLRADGLQGPQLRHERHLVLQWPGPRDRRAPDVPLLADRSGPVHERGRLPEPPRRLPSSTRRAGRWSVTSAPGSTVRSRRSSSRSCPTSGWWKP